MEKKKDLKCRWCDWTRPQVFVKETGSYSSKSIDQLPKLVNHVKRRHPAKFAEFMMSIKVDKPFHPSPLSGRVGDDVGGDF